MSLALDSTALRMLCDAVGDGVILFDATDRVVLVNEAAHRLLTLSPGTIDGLSMHNVMMSYLHVPHELTPRLRAGEPVGCPGPDRIPERFLVRRITLPGMESGECPTVLVVHDRRVAHQLRAAEEALVAQAGSVRHRLERRAQEGVRLLDHRAILRDLAREVRRSRRDGEQLSILLIHGRYGIARDEIEAALTRTLRAGDRAGMLDKDVTDHSDPDSPTLVSILDTVEIVQAREDGEVALVVLPGTGNAGLSAATLRLRTELAASDRSVAFGGATLRTGVGWRQVDQDDAHSVLDRAMRACERDASEQAARRHAATQPRTDMETTVVGPHQDLAA